MKCATTGKFIHLDRAAARHAQAQLPYRDKVAPYPCPDCGGTGDLRDAMGTFTDTREIRLEGS